MRRNALSPNHSKIDMVAHMETIRLFYIISSYPLVKFSKNFSGYSIRIIQPIDQNISLYYVVYRRLSLLFFPLNVDQYCITMMMTTSSKYHVMTHGIVLFRLDFGQSIYLSLIPPKNNIGFIILARFLSTRTHSSHSGCFHAQSLGALTLASKQHFVIFTFALFRLENRNARFICTMCVCVYVPLCALKIDFS